MSTRCSGAAEASRGRTSRTNGSRFSASLYVGTTSQVLGLGGPAAGTTASAVAGSRPPKDQVRFPRKLRGVTATIAAG